ncbi:MAG: hypothetical protein HYV29_02385 [Ignavibacteriales bacterium]|nr:hypothetical protein [Ignavibacteriales bacterium]
MNIVRSKILEQFPNLVFGMSTRFGGVSGGAYDLNMSFNVGDDPEDVKEKDW